MRNGTRARLALFHTAEDVLDFIVKVLRVLGVSSSSLSEILSLTLQCIFQYGTVIAEAEDIQR